MDKAAGGELDAGEFLCVTLFYRSILTLVVGLFRHWKPAVDAGEFVCVTPFCRSLF